MRTTLSVPDAACNVEPVFVNCAPSPIKLVAVILTNPVISEPPELSPNISPPTRISLATPRPPSMTTAPLVTAVELS